jgi:hypothetical protein
MRVSGVSAGKFSPHHHQFDHHADAELMHTDVAVRLMREKSDASQQQHEW